MKLFVLTLAATLAISASAGATSIYGHAKIIDGDTLYVKNIKVRLQGIDAPEYNKPGGRLATNTLKAVVGLKAVRCNLTGDTTYDRMVGVCTNAKGQDLAAEVIRAGAALDCKRYSGGRYRSLEPAGIRSKIRQARYC